MSLAKTLVDPITPAIDAVHDQLGHSPHPAIVMVPLGCWGFSNICDGLGLVTGEEKYDDAARISMGVGLVGAAGAMLTGLRDYSSIPQGRPSHPVATTHALGNTVVGSLFAASYILRLADHHRGRRPSLASRLLGLTGGALSMYTAWLGGVLMANYGEGVEPLMSELSEDEIRELQHRGFPEGDAEGAETGRQRLHPDTPLGPH